MPVYDLVTVTSNATIVVPPNDTFENSRNNIKCVQKIIKTHVRIIKYVPIPSITSLETLVMC